MIDLSVKWSNFNQKGWCFLDNDDQHHRWIEAAKANILYKFGKRKYTKRDFRSGNTWFIGTNFLDNGSDGNINGVSMSSGLWSQISGKFGQGVEYWDPGQVSIFWQGYPKNDSRETEKAFKYRLNKYASHVDGLLPIGPKKRRFAKEYHAFILGLPVINSMAGSAPLVVWEGSHIIFRDLFRRLYNRVSETELRNLDITEMYQKCRTKVFSTCPIRKIFSDHNQPYVLDRHLLHGVVQWKTNKMHSSKKCPNDGIQFDPLSGRIVIYFRPSYKSPMDWLIQN